MSSSSVIERWVTAMHTKAWVTAYADTSRPDRAPVPIDQIVVKIGGETRVVYRAEARDLVLGGPIVSRDGSRLVFSKTERLGAETHKRFYVMDIGGAEPRAVLELSAPSVAIPGTWTGPAPVAWSHDNNTLLALETLRGERRSMPGNSLVLVDVASGATVRLLELGRQIHNLMSIETPITSQAWAPDNRRIVYMNDDAHVVILDVVTGHQEDLGIGEAPTWSPDGTFIAVKIPKTRAMRTTSGNEGDYELIDIASKRRTPLLANPRPFWRRILLPEGAMVGYHGPALWLPDGRFLAVTRYWGEDYHLYVLDRFTGEMAKMPLGFHVHSWGGKP